MARRYLVRENSINHCTWRSHNQEHVFASDGEKEKLLSLMKAHKERYGILVLSYCVMGTHPHVVCIATDGQEAFSSFWRVVNHSYARWYNAQHGRRGQVVMERLSSPRIQDDRHLLNAMRYGDLNPVRAGLVRSAKDWRWSSHAHYALGVPDELIDDAAAFLALGRNPVERRIAYRHLFAIPLTSSLLVKRRDLVSAPFIGDPDWVSSCRTAIARSGVPPPF
ncbi:transposase [Anaeromyxobacter oryzae]|uniref:transposase n=1 Tax=Anaeromyxobacter oryzae TaxID=2918170 RepID=UPI0020C1272E|nr:transposase [Anaeromyxobacter oryzae]